MNREKTIKISAASLRRRHLGRLYESLPKVDADRLETILPLFENPEQSATVAACTNALFSGRETSEAQALLRAFRDRLKKAANKAGVHLTLEVDTRKRLSAEERRCWFLAPDDAAENIADFSKVSAGIDSQVRVESQAAITTQNALEGGKIAVEVFISLAEADRALAGSLLNGLEANFASSKAYSYHIWDRSNVLVGEDSEKETNKALERSTFILALVSSHFLGEDQCIRDLEHNRRMPPKPLIPVILANVSLQRHNLRGLDEKQSFPPLGGKASRRSYQSCRGALAQNEFVQDLFEEVEKRVDVICGQPPAPLLAEGGKPKLPILSIEQARKLAPKETELWVNPSLAFTSLEQDISDRNEPALLAANPQNALDALESWALQNDGPLFAAVLGEYGIGKTTTLKQFTHRLLDRRQHEPSTPLPIFVDLRAYSETIRRGEVPSLREFLKEVFRRSWKSPEPLAIDPDDVIRLVHEEGAILIFDGLDEKLVHLDDAQARAFLRELWGALPPQAFRSGRTGRERQPVGKVGKLLFSCRSHYFKTLQDQGSMLRGEDRDGVRASDYLACILLPFNEEQVREYLGQVLATPRDVDAALDLFASVHNLKELSQRPYLLSLISGQIAKLEAKRARGEQVLGVTLYEMTTREWLNRDEGKHFLQEEDKRRLMEDLAASMWRQGDREWPWEQVRNWLGRRVAGDQVLKARYLGDARQAAILDEDFRTATFVLRPDNSPDSFRFAHSSLQEYFLACQLYRALCESNPSPWDLPMPSVETLHFLGQLLQAEPRAQRRLSALSALSTLLASYQRRATEAAFRYRLLAVQRGWPEPAFGRVDLHGAELEGWVISGGSPDAPLNLRGVDLSGANLVETRWRAVDLSGANLCGARLLRGEFQKVVAANLAVYGADLTASQWRDCRVLNVDGAAEARWHAAVWVDCELDVLQLGSGFQVQGASSRCTAGPYNSPCPTRTPDPPQKILNIDCGHTFGALSCAWSPDGERLLSVSPDRSLKVWDAVSGQCLVTLRGHRDWVGDCAWSPDGARLLSASDDGTLRLWDAVSGHCLLTFEEQLSWVTGCAWSPDGARVLSASSDGTLKVWDAVSGQCLLKLNQDSGVSGCAWSPDGARVLSVSSDGTLKVWDEASGQCVLKLQGKSALTRCAWSPDGTRVLSASSDRTLKVWDAGSGQCVLTLEAHDSAVLACGWSPDGANLLSASDDWTLKVWDASSGQCLLTLRGHTSPVRGCAWSPDGARLLSSADEGNLKVWDASSGQCLLTLQRHFHWVRGCAWSPDGAQLLSASTDGSLKVWDAISGQTLLTLQTGGLPVSGCAWSPDGAKLLSASVDRRLRVWDAVSGDCLLTLHGHASQIFDCVWSPDAERLLSASQDRTVKVWAVESGQCLLTLKGHDNAVLGCAWSPDGARVLSASEDRTVKVWAVESGQCLLTLKGHDNAVSGCAWSPDGARVLSASEDRTLKVWDAASGQLQLTLDGHHSAVKSCAWSPDGARVLSASDDQTLKVWDAVSGLCLLTLVGHGDWVRECAWSPDGARVLSASDDGTVRVWDAASGRELITLLLGPGGETAALDLRENRILAASAEAWRFVTWRFLDPVTKRLRLLPGDYFERFPIVPKGG